MTILPSNKNTEINIYYIDIDFLNKTLYVPFVKCKFYTIYVGFQIDPHYIYKIGVPDNERFNLCILLKSQNIYCWF